MQGWTKGETVQTQSSCLPAADERQDAEEGRDAGAGGEEEELLVPLQLAGPKLAQGVADLYAVALREFDKTKVSNLTTMKKMEIFIK